MLRWELQKWRPTSQPARWKFHLLLKLHGDPGLRLSGEFRWSGDRLFFTLCPSLFFWGVGDELGLIFLPLARVGLPCISENVNVAFIGPCFVEGDGFRLGRTLCVPCPDMIAASQLKLKPLTCFLRNFRKIHTTKREICASKSDNRFSLGLHQTRQLSNKLKYFPTMQVSRDLGWLSNWLILLI